MASAAPIIDETKIDGLEEELSMLREKILFALTLYPFLARSMLHQCLGTSTSRRLWDPILDALLEEGLIKQTTLTAKTPLDRNQTFKVYHLATKQIAIHANEPNPYNIQVVLPVPDSIED
jgi:hypothetical protein